MILPYLNFKTVFSYKTSFLHSGLTLEKVIWMGKCTGNNNNNNNNKQASKKQTNNKQKQSNDNFETCGPNDRLFIYHYHYTQ